MEDYTGLWDTYIPSEYGFAYNLFANGSCELAYDSPVSHWVARKCTWKNAGNKLTVILKDEDVKVTMFNDQEDEAINNNDVVEEYFSSQNGGTITYVVDEAYINMYLKQLYNCKNDLNIKGILAMKPIENTNCKEEWCTLPYFKLTRGSSHKSVQEIEFSCR